VVGSLKSIETYSTEPVDVVIEIVSPDARMSYIIRKCRNYRRVGVAQIFVLDPQERIRWEWVDDSLKAMSEMYLRNGAVISLNEVGTS
jgi:Uma2 family endonuclease